MRNNLLKIRKGMFFTVTTTQDEEHVNKSLYKKSSYNNHLTRDAVYSGICVCDYENLKEVKAERENGKEPKEPWYEWVDYPYIAKGKKNGKLYLVVKTQKNMYSRHTYFHDGVAIKKSDIASEFKASSGGYGRVITIELSTITSFKQGKISWKK